MVVPALDYRIEANGSDITQMLQLYTAQIIITDEAGYSADKLSITLADNGLALPENGAELVVSAGYLGELRPMGKYVVDEVTLAFPPDKMTISASAVPFEQSSGGAVPLQTQKSRSFPAGTINDLVSTIAHDHGLTPAVAPSLAAVTLPHIDQIDESDMNLLTRIGYSYGAIAKANGGSLIFVERGQGKNIRGDEMPVVTLSKSQVTSGSVTISKRNVFNKVVATYRDTKSAEDVELVAGSGKPEFRIKGMFATKERAALAAQKHLSTLVQSKRLSLKLPFSPNLVAEARLTLEHFRTGIDGDWSVIRATHNISTAGGTTSIECEAPR